MKRTKLHRFDRTPRVIALLALTALLLPHRGVAATVAPCSFALDKPTHTRGESLILTVANLPAKAAPVTVTLAPLWGGEPLVLDASSTAVTDTNSTTMSQAIGAEVPLGSYSVDLAVGDTHCTRSDSGQPLAVTLTDNPNVHLDAFVPPFSDVFTQVKSRPTYREVNLALHGHGFQSNPMDNRIYINSVPQAAVTGTCGAASVETGTIGRPMVENVVSDQIIELCGVRVPDNGQLRVEVGVSGHLSEPQVFRVYSYGKRGVAGAAALVTLVLALLPLYLLSSIKGTYKISKQEYKLRLFFLDPETDTYSLSKLQFYLWTVAALFSYVYLFISRVIVQDGSWPDIPDNLPGVIAVAAGTSVSSQLITSAKGSKGAGAVQPSFADFITSGGVVAPDRVQMLLWTLCGIAAFIVAALGQAPGVIQDLPTVPSNLLYMMGLSSAGYLGGKLARKAGPVINEISLSPTDPDAAIGAAAAPTGHAADFTEAIAEVQRQQAQWPTPATAPARTAVDTLAQAVSAARAAENTAQFADLLVALPPLRQAADSAAQAAAQEFASHPDFATDAATAQAAAATLQELCANVTLAIAQGAAVSIHEVLEVPRIARSITIRGTNLSTEAVLQIDNADLPFRMMLNTAGKQMPEIIAREDANPTFARILKLNLDPANLGESDLEQFHTWFAAKGSHTLALTNPDGQMAQVDFDLPPGVGQKGAPSA